MEIILPNTQNAKALFIIDVQPNTLDKTVSEIPLRISHFIKSTDYDAYVVVTYFAEKDSIFYMQGRTTMPKSNAGEICKNIESALESLGKPMLAVKKQTRSCFKGDDPETLHNFLKNHNIAEAHFVGFDINNCVLSSALEACDLGMYTIVIEELSHNHKGDQSLKNSAKTLLRYKRMTNHSIISDISTHVVHVSS